MKDFIFRHRKISGYIGALIALLVATIYYFIVPEEASDTGVIQAKILTYGHTLVWIFLSVASLLWGIGRATQWSKFFANIALGLYIIFICTFLIVKFF